jgi:hypothetical protein
MRATRLNYYQSLEVMRAGQFNRAAYMVKNSWLGATGDDLIDQARARGSEAAYLRWSNALVEIAKLPSETQIDRLQALVPPSQPLPPLIKALSEGANMKTMARNVNRTRAAVNCAAVALAAERYRLAEHYWPERIDTLVPRYLSEVPSDPFDGQPLRLRRRTDGLVVYSIGPDQKDDGGNLDRKNSPQPGMDVGFQLWDEQVRSTSSARPAP